MPMPGKSKSYGSGYMNKTGNMLSLLYTSGIKGSILQIDEDQEEDGPGIILSFSQVGRRGSTTIDLASLTEAELNAVEELFQTAFAWARPIVQKRDAIAQEEDQNEDGNPSERVYRAVPTVHHRKRISEEHSEGVHD